jgi:hypothetical protein
VVPAFLAVTLAGFFLHGGLRDACLFPLLGLFPGIALAGLLPMERGALARWTAGIAVSPLVAASLAWALMQAGVSLPLAARAVAVAGTLGWIVVEWRAASRPRDPGAREGERFAWGCSLAMAGVIALVMFAKPYMQIRADGWIHGGIIQEILARGIPPEDPRFAGFKLNYVWFYNYFIALSASLRGGDPFALMALSDVAEGFATLALAWLAGRQLWRSARAANGALLLMGLGFNAAAILLWPVRLLTVVIGRVRGLGELQRALAGTQWDSAEVLYELKPWRGYMVNFLDKLLHGTAINVAYSCMLLLLWALVAALRGSRTALFWGAAATSGMLFFHGVVGISVIPVTLAALGLAWLLSFRWPAMPPRGRLVAFALAVIVGSLAAAPYTVAISRAWPASRSGLHFSYIGFDWAQWMTMAAALAVGTWFARRALGALREDGIAATIALWTLAMLAFAGTVLLPLTSHTKFIFEVFAGLTLLGGLGFRAELASWRRHLGIVGAFAIGAVVFASTPLITLQGYLRDRTGQTWFQMHLPAQELALYEWMRRETPVNAVYVDALYRSTIMVKASRELLLGDSRGPELAAFPLDELRRRRTLIADVYGPADSLDRDAAELARLGRPAYVLVRAADADTFPTARPHLDARPDLFAPAYERDGFMVYHVRSTPTSGDHR